MFLSCEDNKAVIKLAPRPLWLWLEASKEMSNLSEMFQIYHSKVIRMNSSKEGNAEPDRNQDVSRSIWYLNAPTYNRTYCLKSHTIEWKSKVTIKLYFTWSRVSA